MLEIKRIRRIDRIAQINTEENRTIILKGGLFGLSGAILFFIIGLFVYGDFTKAVMLGVFAFVSDIISLLYLIPVLGIILWILGNFVWGWGVQLTNALNLEMSWAVGVAWWLPSITFFIIGIILTIIILVLVIDFFNED